MMRFCSFWASSALLFAIAVPALGQGQVVLVLDASGSMFNKLADGRYRIEAAKEVTAQFVDSLPVQGVDVGLRIYGSKLPAKDPASCQDSQLFVPVAGNDKATLKKTVKESQALGSTPIAYSLEKTLGDFPAGKAGSKVVVLVTDGEESCKGDVRAAAAKLKAAGIDLRIIGFDLSAQAAATFKGIGTFENAKSAKDLAAALGRAVEKVAAPKALGKATLEAPDEVPAGTAFAVRFKGDNEVSDYITVVKKGTADGEYGAYQYTKDANPAPFTAPVEVGEYEIRYQSDRTSGVAARKALKVTPTEVILDAPEEVAGGTQFEVRYKGPRGQGDYITIVPAGAADGTYTSYSYLDDPAKVTIQAPLKPGAYEVRYSTEREGNKTFAKRPIAVKEGFVVVQAPASAKANTEIEVLWTGPSGEGDYVAFAEVGSSDDTYLNYFLTTDGSPARMYTPEKAGRYELRYVFYREGKVLARTVVDVR